MIGMPFAGDDTESPMEITSAVVNTAMVLTVTGEIDNSNAYRLERAASAAFQHQEAEVVAIDLTQLEFLGSGGLHAMVAMTRQAEERGTPLRFVTGESRIVSRTIELAGMSEYLPLRHSLADDLTVER
jgi:anti-anti-sigma factor